MKKSIYRIILIITGLLHAIGFLAFPYAKLSGLAGGLSQLAGAFGAGDAYPEKLTGLNAVKQAAIFKDSAEIIMALFIIPAAAGLCCALFHVLGKKKLSYVGTILVSLLSVSCYGMTTIALQDYERLGYSSGVTVYLFIALCILQMIVAIVGCVKDKGQEAAVSAPSSKNSKGKSVKVGKKDGSITGVKGSYMGAVIPVKSGASVVIGRDPAVSSIVIKDEKASRKHCEIAFNGENGMYSVTDYSANGTFDSEGGRLPEKTAVPMPAGSEIRIGKDGDVFRLG